MSDDKPTYTKLDLGTYLAVQQEKAPFIQQEVVFEFCNKAAEKSYHSSLDLCCNALMPNYQLNIVANAMAEEIVRLRKKLRGLGQEI